MVRDADFVCRKSTDKVKIFPGAIVVGDVEIGEGSSIWFNAVLRGDENKIIVGKNCNIQDCAVLHCSDKHPTILGEGVTVGHSAIGHSATVGDCTLIGMGAIILSGAVVGKNCLVGAGALVTGKMVIPDGSLVVGSPAVVKRPLTQAELDDAAGAADEYLELSRLYDV